MNTRRRSGATLRAAPFALLAAAALSACARPRPPAASPPPPPPLPELIIEAPTPSPPARLPAAAADPLAGYPPGDPVSLSARDVDLRALIVLLAEQAGVSMVLDPTIQGRTTVNFVNLPALEALRTVLAGAGLAIAAGPPEIPIGPTVFYALPVDIERASAELIQARFRVSAEVARWIVETRLP